MTNPVVSSSMERKVPTPNECAVISEDARWKIRAKWGTWNRQKRLDSQWNMI